MKRLILAALILAGCGKPLYESSGSTSGSSGTSGQTQDITVTGTRRAPNVMFVVDRSGSMADNPDDSSDPSCVGTSGQHGYTCKWDQLLSLMAGDGINSGYVQQLQDTLGQAAGEPAQLGLITYAGSAACDVGVVQEAVAANNAANINRDLDAIAPQGGTPTAATLAVARDALLAAADSTGRDSYVVLLTDGAPNCDPNFPATSANCQDGTQYCVGANACVQSNGTLDGAAPLGCLDEDASVAAVQDLFNNGIQTFVIGFGADFNDTASLANDTLNKMALAGGEPFTANGALTTSFYRASSAADLGASLQDVSNAIQNRCGFRLAEAAPVTISAAKVQSGSTTISLTLGTMLLSTDRKSLTLSDTVCQEVSGDQVSFIFTP
ncbi:MAG: VWA domain-containing protein [Deltaproteobacteria bacterium]|nr:VWA domain-containing protein [Deltaproteobacteria bacterium]